ncbi:MAG: TAXI family TRAP transporter solute-binding subunit [Tagaea sp.]
MIARRALLAAAAALPLGARPFAARAQTPLVLHAGAAGGTFLPYGRALAELLNRAGAGPVAAVESPGSNANLFAVDADPHALGLAFLPSLREAVAGEGFALGLPQRNVRALLAAYPTTYYLVARRDGPARILDLDGRRVGVGPAGGVDEAMFMALARDLFVRATPVSGSAEQLALAMAEGRLDALWIGALVPVPAIAAIAERIDARVIGLSAWEIARLVARNPLLVPRIVPARTYRGQGASFAAVSSWNFLVAHKDLPDGRVEAILRAVFGVTDPARDIHPFAAETRAAANVHNRVAPFHPAAERFHRAAGVFAR